MTVIKSQESICADAASFDLPSTLLSACISEAKNCIDISIKRRDLEKSSDKSSNPDNFAILRGITFIRLILIFVNVCSDLNFVLFLT